MGRRKAKNEPDIEDIDFDEIPPIGAPILSLALLYSVFAVGFGDLMVNLAVGGAGVAIFAAFAFKFGTLYKQQNAKRAVKWATTAPVDRVEDYSLNLQTSSGVEKTDGGITLEHLKEIDPYEFEELVAKVWRARGYDAEVTQGSQDRGVDVVAEKAEPYNEKELIQVKRKGDGQKVGAPTVRRCSGLKNKSGVDKVLIVTSTGFTAQAKEEADDYNLKLVDGRKLLELYEDNVEL
ncbi:MAG: restriction endonuclease [Candidatus Nanohaloarchaea archaeon]